MQSQWQQVNTGLQPGAVLGRRYVIVRELDAGGMGRIYLANQKPFNRPMVVKVMHAELADDATLARRFYREAQAIAQLSHPNTVTVYDFGKSPEGLLFIAMEYVEGVSLGHLLRETGALPLEDAVAFTIQVAQSLGEAHAKGIVHRDLKPDNVMVVRTTASDSFVKVLDFGIAKFNEAENRVTQTGSIVGTPLYMAPEQAQSHPLDGRADLYSLACCFFEMLTGAPPFDGSSAVAILLAHQNKEIPRLPAGFPRALNQFMQRALAKNPNARPETSADFIAALLRVFQEPSTTNEEMLPLETPVEERLRLLGALTPAPDVSRVPVLGRSETLDDGPPGPPPSGAPMTVPSNPLRHAPPSFFDAQVESVPSENLELDDAPFQALEVADRTSRTSKTIQPRRSAWVYATAAATLVALSLGAALIFSGPQTAPVLVAFHFESDPSGATVFINGLPIGRTPLEHRVERSPLGEIRFQHPDRITETFTDVAVTAGDNRLFASLAPRTVTVKIRTEVAGADLRINDLPMGRLTDENGESFVVEWPERELLIELSHPDEGEALRRFPRSSLSDELDARFPRSAFTRSAN